MAENTSYPEKRQQVQSRLKKLMSGQGEVMQGFMAVHKAASSDGALDGKTKELMALAIAVADKCDDCIAFHTHDALKAGASDEEVMDTLGVAISMGGGPAAMYATHAVEALEQFREQG